MGYKISIIGTGNVAWHMAHALDASGHTILQWYGRDTEKALQLAKPLAAQAVGSIEQLTDKTDMLLVCVSDDAIPTVAQHLIHHRCLIAHTSGAVGMEVLEKTSPYYGVLWPLQTLTAGQKVNFYDVPLCIEGSNKAAEMQLTALANTISNHVHPINSDQRKYLHLAAVFANNFSNAMYASAAKILEDKGIDFSLLRPLILETAKKVQSLAPHDAQTGPAKRNDEATLQKHLELLADGSDEEKIYRLLSEVIGK